MTAPETSRHAGLLIKIETDRRLGHEWDEWDGNPLPNGGDFRTGPARYFLFTAIGLVLALGVAAALIYLIGPRLALLATWLPGVLLMGVVVLAIFFAVWLSLVGVSFLTRRALLPAKLAERGLMPRLMPLASAVSELFGVKRDWTQHSSVVVYDRLAMARTQKVRADELLILIPRCLSRAALDAVLDIAKRYNVHTFVATRGQLARRVIRERRPKAVVAVACERDMVSGLHDVAGRVPVLGLTMQLPNGPCKDASIDVAQMEEFVKKFLV